MAQTNIRVLALDLDGTLTNDKKIVTPRTRAALDAAAAQGVTIVLASGRPTAGITPLARELGLDACLLLEMRLGEGSGCPLAFQILKGACAVMCGMGTFQEAAIDDDYLEEIRAADSYTVVLP